MPRLPDGIHRLSWSYSHIETTTENINAEAVSVPLKENIPDKHSAKIPSDNNPEKSFIFLV